MALATLLHAYTLDEIVHEFEALLVVPAQAHARRAARLIFLERPVREGVHPQPVADLRADCLLFVLL